MPRFDTDALIDALMTYTWRDEEDRLIDDAEEKREYIKQWLPELPIVSDWISVKDKLPESGKHVLLTCEIRSSIDGFKKRYVCDGFYSKAHTLPQGNYPEDDVDYDYDEDEDEYYLKEGWYEVIHNWDDYSSVVIYDSVTHWMPLPKPAQEESDNA